MPQTSTTQQNKPQRELEWLHATLAPVPVPAAVGSQPDDDGDEEEPLIADVEFYTGATVPRMDFWTGEKYSLTLSMEPGACDLSRLNSGAPFLNSHNSFDLSDVLGVIEDGSARIENGVGKARVRFSQRPEIASLRADVRAGIIRNVSVGTQIGKLKDITPEDSKQKSYLATSWQPMEISAVAIGADAGAGFLSHQVVEPQIERATAQLENQVENTNTTGAEEQARLDAVRTETIKAERLRVSEINAALKAARITDEDFASSLIEGNVSADEARKQILSKLAANFAAAPTQSVSGAQITRDAQETLALSVENALEHRVTPSVKLEAGREFAHLSLLEMGRAFLEAKTGKKVRGMNKAELASVLMRPTMNGSFETFAPGYAGTTDYPNILANVFNKTLRAAYNAEPQTFKPFTKRGTAPDFKDINRVQLGDVPTLTQLGPNGEYQYALPGDAKEKYNLATYGKIVAINRQTLINDDLGALTRLPESMGRAAARLESDVVWGIITANGNMADGNALFSSTHANYTSSGTAITVASLDVAFQTLRKQTGLNGVGYLNLMPKYIIVPVAKAATAAQFMAQTNIIYTKNSDFNPFAQSMQVISEPRLDVNSTTAWYLSADPGQIDTIEYSYLEGQEGVFMDTRMGFDVDGMELKARLDFAAKAIDWRGLYKNAGA